MRFIDIKSLHVMYYLPFDRLMGLSIVNEFFNTKEVIQYQALHLYSLPEYCSHIYLNKGKC